MDIFTFNDLATRQKDWSWGAVAGDDWLAGVGLEMKKADRSSGDGSTYLQDFLAAHGEEKIQGVVFFNGDAWNKGEGLLFISPERKAKIRRRIEDRLREQSTRDLAVIAAKLEVDLT